MLIDFVTCGFAAATKEGVTKSIAKIAPDLTEAELKAVSKSALKYLDASQIDELLKMKDIDKLLKNLSNKDLDALLKKLKSMDKASYDEAIKAINASDKSSLDEINKILEKNYLKYYSVEDFKNEMLELPHAKISPEIRDEIIGIPKGKKPDPSVYMSNSEIKDHLSLFKDGVVKIQSKEAFENAKNMYGGTIGDPKTGTFALPKSVVNKAIEASNGNPRILEELLGLDPGYLGEYPIILEVNNPSNIRIPSGNEAGAWPEYWIPGGYTSGGVPEVVIDQVLTGQYTISNVYP